MYGWCDDELMPLACACALPAEKRFAGVNYLDTYQRAGLYPVALPFTLGADGAGVVVALGANVANLPLQAAKLQVGDNVGFISRKGGAYAQFISVPASTVAKIPDDLDLATATAAFIQVRTTRGNQWRRHHHHLRTRACESPRARAAFCRASRRWSW